MLRFALAFCLLALLGGGAAAQTCTATSSITIDFGTVNNLSGGDRDVDQTISIHCTATLALTVRACLGIPAGSGGAGANLTPRYLASGGNLLQYNIYSDASHTVVWGNLSLLLNQVGFVDIPLVSTGVLSAAGDGTLTLRGRLPAGQGTAAIGTYQSTATMSLAYAQLLGGVTCGSLLLIPNISIPLTVKAAIVKKCEFNSADLLDFGTRGLLTAAVLAQADIRSTCTVGTPYTVALNQGAAPGATIATRQMRRSGASIFYQLYTDMGRTTVWGDGTTGVVVGDTGDGTSRALRVYGKVPVQATPAAGTYTDSVVITVTY